ncbi:MAG: hypothetical protein HYZ27_10450 [Deltaproteobacteria bacterium]|nr:hypothetical protein [Deltaproteobacteria bacterium]
MPQGTHAAVLARLARIVALTLAVGCGDPLGKPCKTDDDCGPGFDCYPDMCVRVCTKNEECGQGETCYRYHCVVPGQEHVHGKASPAAQPAVRPVPPAPDATVAELRAIRRELELLRQEQKRLADLLDKGRAPSKPKAKSAP